MKFLGGFITGVAVTIFVLFFFPSNVSRRGRCVTNC